MKTFTCPVLAFTPDVETAFHWFARTHQLVSNDGRVYWLRTALPAAGGVGDQDARLMATLEYLRHLHNDLAAEAIARGKDQAALKRWRERRHDSRRKQ